MEAINVLILMGSKSDRPVMQKSEAVLEEFGVPYKTMIRSAHRTPEATMQAVKDAEAAGCQVFICAAGMAAHLAGLGFPFHQDLWKVKMLCFQRL